MNKVAVNPESRQIIRGIKWTGIQMAVNTAFRFLINLFLAKLLLPQDFGLVGMSSVFIAVAAAASELGLSAALIQRKNEEEAVEMYPTAFWSGIGWGILVYGIMSLVIAPFAAEFYDEPLLTVLVPALSLGILLRPLNLIHSVILTRAMNFKRLAQISNIAALIAGLTALLAAYLNFGVWSLALNTVLAVGLTVPMFFFVTKWKPVWGWNKVHFKQIFGFGAYSTGTSIFSTVTYNVDNLMIGKLLGASFLGSYTLAFSLTEQLRQVISNVLNRVMYPVFSKAQDDKVKLRAYFLKIININALFIYPVMGYFLIFAEEIIIGFFGEKWSLSVLPLQILSCAMMVHLLVNSFTSLLRGIGNPKLEMKIIIGLTTFILVPGLLLGITYFGLVGAAIAILINKIALAITGLSILKREIELPILSVFKAVKSSLLGTAVSTAAALFLIQGLEVNSIIVLTMVFCLVYLGTILPLEQTTIKGIMKSMF